MLHSWPGEPWIELIPYKPFSYFVHLWKRLEAVSCHRDPSQRRLCKLMISVEIYHAIRSIFLAFYPLRHSERIVLFDLAYLAGLDPRICNFLLIGTFLVMANSLRVVYLTYNPRLNEIQWDLMQGEVKYLLKRYMVRCGQRVSFASFIHGRMHHTINMLQLLVAVLDIFLVYLPFWLFNLVNSEWKHFKNDSNLTFCLKLVCFVLNGTFSYLNFYVFSHCFVMAGGLFTGITFLFFIKLRQIEKLLKCSTKKLTPAKLVKSIRLHTRTLVDIFLFNHHYARRCLMVYLIGIIPLNLYYIFALLNLNLNPIFRLIILTLTLYQLWGAFGVHYACALYTKRIHGSLSKRLYHYDCRLCFTYLGTQLKLANHLERIHTKNRYGVTYGPLGLVTMTGFFKYLMLYGKFQMMAFKLLHR